MKRFLYSILIVGAILIFSGNLFSAYSQEPNGEKGAVTPNGAIGNVIQIDKENKQLTLYIDEKKTIKVVTNDATEVIKIPAGDKDAKRGVKIAFSDISLKDRVYAIGRVSDDQSVVLPRRIIVQDITTKEKQK